jgi:hypothetical protein
MTSYNEPPVADNEAVVDSRIAARQVIIKIREDIIAAAAIAFSARNLIDL